MQPRFKVIGTTQLDDGSKRYRVVDLVEGGSASKHGVFEVRADAHAICLHLNAEYPLERSVRNDTAQPMLICRPPEYSPSSDHMAFLND